MIRGGWKAYGPEKGEGQGRLQYSPDPSVGVARDAAAPEPRLVQQERTSDESDGLCKSRERSITIGSRMGARNLFRTVHCLSCIHVGWFASGEEIIDKQ
jgi:hypothetical protein